MELNNVRKLYDYNRWAGRHTLTAAGTLASDKFLRPMGNSFSSVRDTLVHILGAEWIWLERWQGRSPKALLNPAAFPTVQSLKLRWETVERDQMQFIEALTPPRLGEELEFRQFSVSCYDAEIRDLVILSVVLFNEAHCCMVNFVREHVSKPCIRRVFGELIRWQ